MILKVSNLIPRGIDINPLLEEAKRQLQEEADYLKESAHLLRYQKLLSDHPDFVIPELVAELTTKDVLAMSFVSGKALESLKTAPQADRDRVMSKLFELLFREMFEFNCIQTDPNFANYLYDEETKKLSCWILVQHGCLMWSASRPIAA